MAVLKKFTYVKTGDSCFCVPRDNSGWNPYPLLFL